MSMRKIAWLILMISLAVIDITLAYHGTEYRWLDTFAAVSGGMLIAVILNELAGAMRE